MAFYRFGERNRTQDLKVGLIQAGKESQNLNTWQQNISDQGFLNLKQCFEDFAWEKACILSCMHQPFPHSCPNAWAVALPEREDKKEALIESRARGSGSPGVSSLVRRKLTALLRSMIRGSWRDKMHQKIQRTAYESHVERWEMGKEGEEKEELSGAGSQSWSLPLVWVQKHILQDMLSSTQNPGIHQFCYGFYKMEKQKHERVEFSRMQLCCVK